MSGTAVSNPLSNADLKYLGDVIGSGTVGSVDAVPFSAVPFLALQIHEQFDVPVICVTDGPKTQDTLYSDLLTLGGGPGDSFAYYPGWEALPREDTVSQADLIGDRFQTLIRLLHRDVPDVLVTTVQAMMQRTVMPKDLREGTRSLAVGEEADLERITRELEHAGYAFRPELAVKGEAALRGGLLDLWPLTEPWPLRIEFFGSTIESIRRFDPTTQRSIDRCDSVRLTPAAEFRGTAEADMRGDVFGYLPRSCCWIWVYGTSIEHHAAVYEETNAEMEAGALTLTYAGALDRARELSESGWFWFGSAGKLSGKSQVKTSNGVHALTITAVEGVPALPDTATGTPDILEQERDRFIGELAERQDAGERLRFFFSTEGARDRFVEQQQESHPGLIDGADIHVARLSEGFRLPPSQLTIVAENDIYGRRKQLRGRYDLHARRKGPPRHAGERVADWTDLQPGELVVHVDHGIGEYLGLQELDFNGTQQEVLAIRYDENARLYIPVGQSQMLTRYVGVGGRAPRLHRLGGRRWKNEKTKAERSLRDLAGVMLETQAERELHQGFTYAPDTPWQLEFEGSFPFEETPDQDRAIRDVKQDMERARPMDRLVCGDVGYGKTEVAMRAAFKATMDGMQVALLVPTTILAQQHYDTFTSRMAAFPISVAMLSRFQTRGTQSEIVRRVKEGAIDIVIGTHRLIQKDVAFKDLGLLIIDEEQRFGVEQKETIKLMRKLVDVLTLTATPIPRTLYMSLLGAKDMSTIQSPPQERLPVVTHVEPYTDDVVRQAILRELNREGQVFYLHNRVMTIDRVAQRLDILVPEARIAVAHGQMHERALAGVMRAFVDGQYDVLLCTTIIESGVDIPNVNTIIIDRADRFGLSDLYQLRGRVGRYKHEAYAYLLLPRHGRLLDTARQRIGALRRYGGLGAGFKLALKDLEIRGAGNLLGSEQSGHITAIGFELYCQFLKRTVARIKGQEVPPLVDVELKLDFISLATKDAEEDFGVVIPMAYIDDEDVRVHAYRRVATVSKEKEVEALYAEFKDRFGPMPPALDRLLKIALVRVLAADRGVKAIETRDEKIMMTRNGEYIKDGRLFPRFKSDHPYNRLEELVDVVRRVSPRDTGARQPRTDYAARTSAG